MIVITAACAGEFRPQHACAGGGHPLPAVTVMTIPFRRHAVGPAIPRTMASYPRGRFVRVYAGETLR